MREKPIPGIDALSAPMSGFNHRGVLAMTVLARAARYRDSIAVSSNRNPTIATTACPINTGLGSGMFLS